MKKIKFCFVHAPLMKTTISCKTNMFQESELWVKKISEYDYCMKVESAIMPFSHRFTHLQVLNIILDRLKFEKKKSLKYKSAYQF